MKTQTAPFGLAKCPCKICNGNLEFDPIHSGETISCPHCAMETVLYIPYVSPPPAAKPKHIDPSHVYCPSCGSIGQPKTVTKGSFLIELILWCFLLLPGLIYSVWRLTSRGKACRTCGQAGIIPVNSPRAQQLLATLPN